MSPTLFTDKIYSATDLNRKSGELLSAAAEKPITVMGSSGAVVMQSRERAACAEQAANWFESLAPAVLLVVVDANLDNRFATALAPELAWVRDLSPEHRRAMLAEVFSSVPRAFANRDFQQLEEVLYDWKATAEVDADEELKADLKDAVAGSATR